jgi:hypothetical protein
MRRLASFLFAALCAPPGAHAQSLDVRDWQVVCDNSRTCRAAGYSAEGSAAPVSVLFSRASGPGRPVRVELQLGTLGANAARPASVVLTVAGKPAGSVRVDRDNHADLPAPAAAAVLKAVVGGSPVAFTAGKSTWRLSLDGAVEALQKMDDVQGRSGRPSALVRKGPLDDADVASAMGVPRFEATSIPTAQQAGDDALVVRVLSAIRSTPDCPLLDDGASQSRARLWHLDANRLLVSQACHAAADGGGAGYWTANLRPPYSATPLTTTGADYDGTGTIHAHDGGAAGDCGGAQAWTWNGYRFEQTYAATGGLCRGVKAGGAWALPSLVTDVIDAH